MAAKEKTDQTKGLECTPTLSWPMDWKPTGETSWARRSRIGPLKLPGAEEAESRNWVQRSRRKRRRRVDPEAGYLKKLSQFLLARCKICRRVYRNREAATTHVLEIHGSSLKRRKGEVAMGSTVTQNDKVNGYNQNGHYTGGFKSAEQSGKAVLLSTMEKDVNSAIRKNHSKKERIRAKQVRFSERAMPGRANTELAEKNLEIEEVDLTMEDEDPEPAVLYESKGVRIRQIPMKVPTKDPVKGNGTHVAPGPGSTVKNLESVTKSDTEDPRIRPSDDDLNYWSRTKRLKVPSDPDYRPHIKRTLPPVENEEMDKSYRLLKRARSNDTSDSDDPENRPRSKRARQRRKRRSDDVSNHAHKIPLESVRQSAGSDAENWNCPIRFRPLPPPATIKRFGPNHRMYTGNTGDSDANDVEYPPQTRYVRQPSHDTGNPEHESHHEHVRSAGISDVEDPDDRHPVEGEVVEIEVDDDLACQGSGGRIQEATADSLPKNSGASVQPCADESDGVREQLHTELVQRPDKSDQTSRENLSAIPILPRPTRPGTYSQDEHLARLRRPTELLPKGEAKDPDYRPHIANASGSGAEKDEDDPNYRPHRRIPRRAGGVARTSKYRLRRRSPMVFDSEPIVID